MFTSPFLIEVSNSDLKGHLTDYSLPVAASINIRTDSEKLIPTHHIRSEFLEVNLCEALC